MAVLKSEEALSKTVKDGVKRRLINTETLMMVVIDFDHGPWKKPDPTHSHVHEQTTYVVEGEIIFFCEGEVEEHLKAGDMFSVPSGKEHTIQLLTRTAKLIDSFTPLRQEFIA